MIDATHFILVYLIILVTQEGYVCCELFNVLYNGGSTFFGIQEVLLPEAFMTQSHLYYLRALSNVLPR